MTYNNSVFGGRTLISRERTGRGTRFARTWSSFSSLHGTFANTSEDAQDPDILGKRIQMLVTVACVATWMGCNLAVLLLNKLLLTFWAFKQPVLLTFLHMISATAFTWGLRSANLLTIQRIQSTSQLLKLTSMSLVFALAVLCANVSLKYLAVSMNQAIGAATPVFAAVFAFLCQRQIEHGLTYATLLLVVGGVIVASGVEPDLHLLGAFVCFVGAAFRGLRAVLQAILLRPEEKLDSISCLAYMVPVSSALMLAICPIVEPAGMSVLMNLPWAGTPMVLAVTANCMAAFGSNYFNMAVTKRTSALTIQVLGQCKGVISAVVSVLCFRNVVPVFGWLGYGITVIGCILYGRCKVHFGKLKAAAQLGLSAAASEKQWLQQAEGPGAGPHVAGATMEMGTTMDLGSAPSNSLLPLPAPHDVDVEAQQQQWHSSSSRARGGRPPRDPHSNGRHAMHAQAEGTRSGSTAELHSGSAAAALVYGPHTNHERLAHDMLQDSAAHAAAPRRPYGPSQDNAPPAPSGLRGLLAATLLQRDSSVRGKALSAYSGSEPDLANEPHQTPRAGSATAGDLHERRSSNVPR